MAVVHFVRSTESLAAIHTIYVCVLLFISPSHGTFKPVDSFLVGRFLGMPAKGEWVLRVLDGVADGSNGTVTEWSLDMEMKPCHWQSALR